jgi:hypothetical protein
MHKKKFQLQTLALALMLAVASLATADELPQGPGTVTLTNTSTNIWTAAIGSLPSVGPFTHVYTFIPEATVGSYAWTSVANLSFTLGDSITFGSATLNSIPLITGSTPVPMGGTYNFAGLLSTPVSGPLVLTIIGNSSGGAYGGNFTVAMAPVPEPATYGMMIGGLGVLAMLARRRRQP